MKIVVPDRAVDLGVTGFPLVEPSLAVDPRNALHLLIGVIVEKKPDLSESDCIAAATLDGGKRWARHEFGLKDCSDPYVAFNADGSAVIVMLSSDSSGGIMLTSTSPDGGRTWSAPFKHPGGNQDHGTLVVDGSSGPFAKSVFVTAQMDARDALGRSRPAIYVGRSDDGGRTFNTSTKYMASNVSLTSMNPVVLSDGTLVISYADFGRTMSDGQFAWLSNERDWVVSSRDGGKTFGSPAIISESCGRTFPVLGSDTASARFKDRLYWICNDRLFEKVWLHYSSDRGERWSDPVQVNRGSGRQPYVRTPALAVNREGTVLSSWYDGRATGFRYRQIFRCQEFFVSASLDGGQTFHPEMKISTARNCPDTPANGEAGRRWPAGGEYTGIAADSDGRFHLVWPDSRDGIYKLRYASIEVTR